MGAGEVGDDQGNFLPDDIGGFTAENIFSSEIEGLDAAILVQGDDAIGHSIQDRAQLRLAQTEPLMAASSFTQGASLHDETRTCLNEALQGRCRLAFFFGCVAFQTERVVGCLFFFLWVVCFVCGWVVFCFLGVGVLLFGCLFGWLFLVFFVC